MPHAMRVGLLVLVVASIIGSGSTSAWAQGQSLLYTCRFRQAMANI